MRGLQASGLASLALRLWSPRGARLWGSGDQDAALPGAEGRRGGRSAGEGRPLGVCCFSAAFQGAVEKAGRRARHTEQPLRPHDHLHQLRGDANSEIYGGPSPPPCMRSKEGEFSAVTFFFLVPTVAAALRTSRRGRAHFNEPGFLRGQAPRDAGDAARAPGLPCALQTWPEPARGRPGGPGRRGPEVLRAAGEGALWPAAAAWSRQRWPRRVPGHRRAAGAPAVARSAPLPRRVNSGKRKIIPGAFE